MLRLLGFTLAASAAALPTTNQWFVAPGGNDSWSGRLPVPGGDDGPVATIQRAAALVRARADRSSPAVVSVAPGRYSQPGPLVFGARDGGDGPAASVTWRGVSGQPAALSFGVALGKAGPGGPWTPLADGSKLWTRTLPLEARAARQLWQEDGSRMTRARVPSAGSNFRIPLDGALPGNVGGGFVYKDGDLNRQYANLSEVEVIVYASWSASRHYISELNTSSPGNLTVRFTANCLNPPAGMWPNSGNRYYLEGDRSFVDSPGEFHINTNTGLITLYPPDDVPDPNGIEWIVDRGAGLKTAVQLKESSLPPASLLLDDFRGGSQPVVMPAATLPLTGDAFNISFWLQLPVGTGAGMVLTRGPAPFEHVPQAMTVAITGGKLVIDVGWECTLFGSSRLDDGKLRRVELTQSNKQLRLWINGSLDATVDRALSIASRDAWRLTVGSNLPVGSVLSQLTYAQTVSAAVRHMQFENLIVEHVGWSLGRDEAADFQSSSFLDSAAVNLHNATDIVLRNVSVRHVGGYAVWVESSSRDVTIDGADIYDVSGGVRVGRGNPLSSEPADARTQRITIHNSKIRGGALVYREAAGVLVQHADAVSLTRSEVSYFNHVAVSFGWVWGFSPQASRDNRIEFNHVHHVGNSDLSDLGGIYMLGVQPNSTVRGNLVHDSHPYFMYGHGIYLDEGASGINITQNWVRDAYAALYMQHYGVNNSVTSNVWARATGRCVDFETVDGTRNHYCPGHLWHCAYRYQPCSFDFASNILLAGQQDNTFWHQPAEGYCNTTSERNLYWNASGTGLSHTFPSSHQPPCPGYACNLHSLNPNASLADWQARGHDSGSLVQDPLFVDSEQNDFNLREGSPALGLGFKPLDLTHGVGPDW